MNHTLSIQRLLSVVAMQFLLAGPVAADSPRERMLLDADWKFHLGDVKFEENIINAGVNEGPAARKFNDAAWRTVNLPHDWGVELPFDENASGSHGYKALGRNFPTNSIGWYRHTFTLSDGDKGKRLWLEFDGVYRNCRVFLNGFLLEHHEAGYNGFRCDITDVARYDGKNVVAVRVDATQVEGWFYEGAGIYRHVWLVKTMPLAIAPDGVFVYSSFPNNVPRGAATIHLQTSLSNHGTNPAPAIVRWQILGPGGAVIATADAKATVDGNGQSNVEKTAKVKAPVLWSPESPTLYNLVTTVESGGQVLDREETSFGIRTVEFDPATGLLLNGKHYAIHGTCNHQDHAGVGSALPDALQYFRVSKLREMGCNAIRTSHNEPTAELLEACDRLGMLVMDESRYFASNPQSQANLTQQICRDRNHPCVFIWSLGNEEPLQRSEADAAIANTLRTIAHKLDPTRLCTVAMSSWSPGKPDGISLGVDVQGFNYFNNSDIDAFRNSNPGMRTIGTEEGSDFYTRGIYSNTPTYIAAYDANFNGNGAPAEKCWQFYAERPWVSGTFIWTGFDYRGETTPFGWPNISSEFGILDTCGFPKDIFYYYQSWWSTNVVLHLLPHWNWSGREGQEIRVWCFSNCRQVELFLNGESLGKKDMPRNSHLEWPVKYQPGTLSAKGYDDDGKVVAETKTETTDAAAGIKLSPDRATIKADGHDCSVVTVAVTDSEGRAVPTAGNEIHFDVVGPGKIIGVGNGDPACHEPDVYFGHPDSRTLTLNDWHMMRVPDVKDRPEVAERFDDSAWGKVNVQAEDGPLTSGQCAVYRAQLQLASEDLAVVEASLSFGMIDDEGWVYVNGQLVGESHNWNDAPSFDVRKFLHAGDNTIAVAVKNNDGPGGLNKGVILELAKAPVAANWQRSVFNGLAQVIVQADTEAGAIQLKASADRLTAQTVTVQAEK